MWRVLRTAARAARFPARTHAPHAVGRKLATAAAAAAIVLPLVATPLCDAGPERVPDDDDAYVDVSALQAQWDEDWDGRVPRPESDSDEDARDARRRQRGAGVRYIMLVRHGQYDTHGADDEHRGLTALGHRQAEHAGARIAAMLAPAEAGGDVSFGGARHRVAAAAAPPPAAAADAAEGAAAGASATPPPPPPPAPTPRFVSVVSSDMRRARETAAAVRDAVSYTHLTLPTTPYV